MSGRTPLDPRRVRRILVIRRKALGDALVTLPAVLRLAEAFPGAALDLVVDRPFAPLLAELGRGLRVLPWPPPAGEERGWLRRLRATRYDIVIDYLGSPRTALWTALSGAPLRVGYDLGWRGRAYNVRVPRNRDGATSLAAFAGEAFLDPLRALGLDPAPWRPATGPAGAPVLGTAYVAWTGAWRPAPGPRVGLALSATWPAKAWPIAEAGALAFLAEASGTELLLIPGPGDETLVAAFRNATPRARVSPPTTLAELGDLLGRLDLLVATDCGVRHLAVALGVPTVTLFGPTDPRGWNPAHPDHVAARTGEPCSPCDLTVCPVPGHPCMTGLTGSLVWAKVQALLERAPARGDPARGRRG